MAIEPEFTAFERAYDSAIPQVLYTKLIADLETPVSAFLKLGEGRENAFLLESVQGGETRGRYSIIGLKPDLIWRCRDGKAEINRHARADASKFVPDANADKPLVALSDGASKRSPSDGCRSLRISWLRHGSTGRAAWASADRPTWVARCHPHTSDHHRHL
jgi:anthranilate/para-aminobenzoate synthase component I